jgi:two-component system, chemotaxis family, chemotaxis protein CheY
VSRECHILDDSRVVRAFARTALRALDFVVSESCDAERALDYCATMTPDVILVDWNLPGMSGVAFIRTLRARGATPTKLLLCSTEKRDDVVRTAMAAGADGYLAKPFDAAGLADQFKRFGLI